MFLPLNDRDSMRILGNALSVQQATFVLTLVLRMLHSGSPLPSAAVDAAESMRLTASNCVLLEVQDGWLMSHPSHLGHLLASRALRTQIKLSLLNSAAAFREVRVAAGEGPSAMHFRCQASEHLQVDVVAKAFNLEAYKVLQHASLPGQCVDAASPATVPLLRSAIARPGTHCLHVIAHGMHFLLHRHQPDILAQLHQVFRALPTGCGQVPCFNVAGTRVSSIEDTPPLVLATVLHDEVTPDAPICPVEVLEGCRPLSDCSALTVAIPASCATDWWFFCPTHLIRAVGFDVLSSHSPLRTILRF